jgi:hypothetical protein
MVHLLPVYLVSFALVLSSCVTVRPPLKSTPSTLDPMTKLASKVVPDFKLGFAEKNGITKYTVYQDTVNDDAMVEDTRKYVVRIVFNELTEEQYKLLMNHYGGQGFVPYDSNRKFELIDFLPPKLQAYINRWMITTEQVDARIPQEWQSPYHPNEPVKTGVTMNCWTTAFEMLREWGKPWNASQGKIGYFGPADAEKLFTRNTSVIAKQETLPRTEWGVASIEGRNRGRLPGDLLHIKTKYSYFGPAHVALWIDEDLYFEKTNSYSDDPIRLAFYSDVIKPYLEQDDVDRPMVMEYIRFKPNSFATQESLAGQDPFDREGLTPLPEEVKKNVVFTLDLGMGGNLKEFSANRILTFPIVRDEKTGRATLKGAEDLKSFLVSNEICRSSYSPDLKFNYKVTVDLQLFVFNAQGKEVARIQGKRGGANKVLAEFRTSDKVLTVSRMNTTSPLFSLNHPGVSSDITLGCIRSDVFK